MQAKYYYFSPLDFDTVFMTQVIGWVNVYREHGLDCTIVKLNPARRTSLRQNWADRSGIRKLFDGKLIFLSTLPDKYLLTKLINAACMLAVIAPALLSGKAAVIQIRSSALQGTLNLLKRMVRDRIKIIWDSRAAAAEEYLYSQGQVTGETRVAYEKMLNNDRKMILLADRVFCVSSILADYNMKLVGGKVNSKKFFLYPGNADERYFYYSEKVRLTARDELGVGDRFVVAYSGGLEMPWHVPDLLFIFFEKISAVTRDTVLLVLSKDRQVAFDYAAKYGIDDDRIIILSADNRKVHRYLNAADIGTLFRTDDIMNRVSSPTKFAEYLMCGLPVAISPRVGDLSGVVEKTGWGIVYDGASAPDINALNHKRSMWSVDRQLIADFGYSHFSKQSAVNRVLKAYSELHDNKSAE